MQLLYRPLHHRPPRRHCAGARLRARDASSVVLCAAVASACLALGCEDPLAGLEALRQEGSAPAQDAGDSDTAYADDAAGKARSQGHSLGPNHAKRLYYQFVDDRGRVRFVERMSDVPAKWQGRVGFVEMDSPPPLSPAMAEQTRDRRYAAVSKSYRQSPRATGAMPAQVILYSADWCGWCKKAKAHLDRTGVNYQVRDIDRPENLQELVAKTGQKGIPVLDVGGKVVTGFSPEKYDQLIRATRT